MVKIGLIILFFGITIYNLYMKKDLEIKGIKNKDGNAIYILGVMFLVIFFTRYVLTIQDGFLLMSVVLSLITSFTWNGLRDNGIIFHKAPVNWVKLSKWEDISRIRVLGRKRLRILFYAKNSRGMTVVEFDVRDRERIIGFLEERGIRI